MDPLDKSYLNSNPALEYEQGQRRIERQRTVEIQRTANDLVEQNPDLDVDAALIVARQMVDSDPYGIAALNGVNPMQDLIDRNTDYHNVRKAVSVREAEDAVKASEPDWVRAGKADPALAGLAVDDLKDRLKAQMQAAPEFSDAHFSHLQSDEDRAWRQVAKARVAEATKA